MNIALCLSNAFWLGFGKTVKSSTHSFTSHTYKIQFVENFPKSYTRFYNPKLCPHLSQWQWNIKWLRFYIRKWNIRCFFFSSFHICCCYFISLSACLFYFTRICISYTCYYCGAIIIITIDNLNEHDFKVMKCRTLKAISPFFDTCRDI